MGMMVEKKRLSETHREQKVKQRTLYFLSAYLLDNLIKHTSFWDLFL